MIFISDLCTCKGILSLKQPLLHNSENGGVCRAMYLTWLGPHWHKSWLDRQHARQCSSVGERFISNRVRHPAKYSPSYLGARSNRWRRQTRHPGAFILLSFHNRTPPHAPLETLSPLCCALPPADRGSNEGVKNDGENLTSPTNWSPKLKFT